jgi:exonuclease III
METFKIATLNFNCVSSPTKFWMLEDGLRREDLDVSLLQEVTALDVGQILEYTTYYNIGTMIRGTAIIERSTMQFTKITDLRQDEQ